MKVKAFIIGAAATAIIGSGIYLHSDNCPFKDVKPCQAIKGKIEKKEVVHLKK